MPSAQKNAYDEAKRWDVVEKINRQDQNALKCLL